MESSAPDVADAETAARELRTERRGLGTGQRCPARRPSNARCASLRRHRPSTSWRSQDWDAHRDLEKNHSINAKTVDKPIAGLLADLQARGLLDSTLVVWTSEFGRTSYGQSGNGRDHNPWGYTQWMAGGGVKAGFTLGQTDEIGLKSVGKAVDTYDLHATVLNQLGLDHLKLTFQNNGRSERPTVVYGEVVKDLVA